jgi:hypothetical protein
MDYRYPDAVVEMRELPKSDAQSELGEMLSLTSFDKLDLNALNETQKSILFKAAQKLHAKQYMQLLNRAYDLTKNDMISRQQYKWALFPSSKHLRNMWTEVPPSEELKGIALKAREIMGPDSDIGQFMTRVIIGEIASSSRGFDPEAKPSRAAITPPPGVINANPTPAPPLPDPTASPHQSMNPVWWFVGAIATLCALVLVVRRKKNKAGSI